MEVLEEKRDLMQVEKKKLELEHKKLEVEYINQQLMQHKLLKELADTGISIVPSAEE